MLLVSNINVEGALKCNASAQVESCFFYVFMKQYCVMQFIGPISDYQDGTCTFSRAPPSVSHCKLLNFAGKWEVTLAIQSPPTKTSDKLVEELPFSLWHTITPPLDSTLETEANL